MDGDAAGEAAGLAVAMGAGVAAVFGFVTVVLFGAPEQAPNTATPVAKTTKNIVDLLIVFLLKIGTRGRKAVRS